MRALIAVLKRVGLVLLSWIMAGSTFGFIPLLLDRVSTAERLETESAGFTTVGIWFFYRIGARAFHFARPKGRMRVAVDIGWTLFVYSFVAGVIVAAVGHPTLAGFIVGLPAAILTYFFLSRERQRDTAARSAESAPKPS